MTTTQEKPLVVKMQDGAVTIRIAEGNAKTIPYATLENAAENNGTLTAYYAELLSQAEHFARVHRPTQLAAAETNTNVYGVLGLGLDGRWHQIRWFELPYFLRADEGIGVYSRADAKGEAQEIASRHGIPYSGYRG
jgi:hypothetical protein